MILHIISRAEWDEARAQGSYTGNTLATEGFIHCSTPSQVLGPANQFYRGRDGLLLLVIDPDRLASRLVYEDLYNHGGAFPHIYGPLNLDAVVDVVDFPPNPDGSFSLPDALQEEPPRP